jgi:hypothetical protein
MIKTQLLVFNDSVKLSLEIRSTKTQIGAYSEAAATLLIMSLRFMALELMTDENDSMGSELPALGLSRSESLLDVGWHMETAVWKMLRPPSHRSSRID